MVALGVGARGRRAGAVSRPLVGITTYGEPVSYGPWRDQSCVFVPEPYVRQIERAGGVQVLIPPLTDCGAEVVDSILARIDALVLAGGADIDPLRYADIRHSASDAPRSERDDTEIALARRTAELDIPVLGVCRRMQPARASLVGRAAELGFTDVITHWPRQDTVYVGSRETLETVATDVIPRLR